MHKHSVLLFGGEAKYAYTAKWKSLLIPLPVVFSLISMSTFFDFVLLNIKMYEMMIMRRLISRITHDADEDFLTLLCR